MRTAKKMGVKSIAVYSEADRNSMHVAMVKYIHWVCDWHSFMTVFLINKSNVKVDVCANAVDFHRCRVTSKFSLNQWKVCLVSVSAPDNFTGSALKFGALTPEQPLGVREWTLILGRKSEFVSPSWVSPWREAVIYTVAC